jgi:hypothetical protein
MSTERQTMMPEATGAPPPPGWEEEAVLGAFSRRSAYWTSDLTLLTGLSSVRETYWVLERLEERRIVERVVRLEPVSWRLTDEAKEAAATPAGLGILLETLNRA